MRLDDFKKSYEFLQKKYSLPDFNEMNSAFDIGKIKRDSGNLLRDVRRLMNEKISYYMRLLEVMINPSQAPPTFLILLKEVNKEDKKIIDSVFSNFIEIEIDSYKLNIASTEVQEAKFISKIYKVWNEKIVDLTGIINILERNLKQIDKLPKPSRGYFS